MNFINYFGRILGFLDFGRIFGWMFGFWKDFWILERFLYFVIHRAFT